MGLFNVIPVVHSGMADTGKTICTTIMTLATIQMERGTLIRWILEMKGYLMKPQGIGYIDLGQSIDYHCLAVDGLVMSRSV